MTLDAVGRGMGYVIAIAIAVLLVPIVFILLSRRSASQGGIRTPGIGVTPSEPSSDQPTPPNPDASRRIPPG